MSGSAIPLTEPVPAAARSALVADPADKFTPGYRRMALIILTLIYVFNFVDRQVVNILAESIKNDLALSDTQLGMITGIAFALFYSLLGLPIARFAEHGDRPKILAVAVTIWSGFTIMCGFANSFAHMLVARLGVGVGEAGGVPPSHSLITEFTPKDKRASALALYSAGLPTGALVGLALGGVIADAYGWRVAFFLAGVPGLLIALLAFVFLKEPRREIAKHAPKIERESVWTVLKRFAALRTFRWVIMGASLQGLVFYGFTSFLAPFYLRNHADELATLAAGFGLESTGFLGIALGLTMGLAGALGTFCGGWLADRVKGDTLKAYPTVPAVASLVAVPIFYALLTTASLELSLVLLAAGGALTSVYLGPTHAICQGLSTPRSRATMSALTLVIINLIGLGIGPPLVGLISDYAHNTMSLSEGAGLRMAMLAVVSTGIVAGLAFWMARRTVDADTVS